MKQVNVLPVVLPRNECNDIRKIRLNKTQSFRDLEGNQEHDGNIIGEEKTTKHSKRCITMVWIIKQNVALIT